jgi:hypothetical protein
MAIPGQRKIEHTMEVTGLERAPEGTVFVVGPMHLGNGLDVLGPGVRFTVRSKYARPYLYALSKDHPPLDGVDVGEVLASLDVPRSAQYFGARDVVPTSSPIERRHTVWEFLGIEGKRVVLRHVTTTCHDSHGRKIVVSGGSGLGGWLSASGLKWPPLLLSLVGLAGLIVMHRRRRPLDVERGTS